MADDIIRFLPNHDALQACRVFLWSFFLNPHYLSPTCNLQASLNHLRTSPSRLETLSTTPLRLLSQPRRQGITKSNPLNNPGSRRHVSSSLHFFTSYSSPQAIEQIATKTRMCKFDPLTVLYSSYLAPSWRSALALSLVQMYPLKERKSLLRKMPKCSPFSSPLFTPRGIRIWMISTSKRSLLLLRLPGNMKSSLR